MSTKPVAAKKPATKKTPAAPKEKKSATSKKEVETAADGAVVDKKERKRRDVSKETVDLAFDELQSRIEAEIKKLRESTEKVRGIKFLRSMNKTIKTLHSDTKRVMKLKKRNNRKKSVVSGFLKPIKITPELAAFTGWDIAKEYSRVDVTKHICGYIKENHLYKEEDKRLILPDEKLKVLLKYDPANPPNDPKTGKPAPLNYFRLQRYLKPHFIKIDTPKEVTTESDESSSSSSGSKVAPVKKAAPAKKAAVPAKKAATSKKVEVEDENDVEDEEMED